ncbi:MAG: hypothetical protein CMB80_28055 [Flammeovirgaceae bacterium]|nr:hypothetical protein [Flammeovirgaceae bacterium]MBR09079.1 hypothetical protein [Rickettsiales bacterium]HCX20685.1 hypothetical protein [Cytophagales bacterium]|tara:strand:- start:1118 stop:2020 length:903 start_codon:yes stop_codon:yes gene_type:complete
MKGKNKKLLGVFVLLLISNLIFLFVGGKSSGVSFNEQKFALLDTAGVSFIKLNDIKLSRGPQGHWLVDEEYAVDPNLDRLLFSILNRVRVQKPVEVPQEEGIKVEISGDQPMTFHVWGNPTKTRTYFSMDDEEEVYQVQIPGYNEYVGGIFELNKDQWRDRLVLNDSWRTIQKLQLDYQDESKQDLTISFDKDFFLVEGVQQLDSNLVVNYLNQFQYFQANEWISKGRFPRYDSLSAMPVLAKLTIESINYDLPILLEIYPKLPGDRIYLVMTYDESMFVVDDQRMSQILLENKDFEIAD